MLANVSSSGVSFFSLFFLGILGFRIFNCYFRTGDDGSSKGDIPKQEDGWMDGAMGGRGKESEKELEENR